MFDTIKELFDMGLYQKEDLVTFVQAGWITQEQVDALTAENT